MFLFVLLLIVQCVFAGKLYFVVYSGDDATMSFSSAVTQCKLRNGGILAHIKSSEEAAHALKALGGAESAWIALTRSANEWRWLDSTALGNYSNWKQDMDNNNNCASVSRGKWDTQHCTTALLHHALCEIATRASGVPVEFALQNSPQRSWTSAQSMCINLNGVLAKIDSMEQVLQAQNVIGTVNAWIGLTRLNLPGFQWQDGTSIGPFTFWNTGRPGATTSCVEMIPATGRWYDNTCPTTRPFICEFLRTAASFQQCPVRHTHALSNETVTFPANSTLRATLTCGGSSNNNANVARVLYITPQVTGTWSFHVAGTLEIRKSCFGEVMACTAAALPSSVVFLQANQEYTFLVTTPYDDQIETVEMQVSLVSILMQPVVIPSNNSTCPNSYDLSFGATEHAVVAQYNQNVNLTTDLSCYEQTALHSVQVIYFTPLVSGVWQLQVEGSIDTMVMEIRESCFGNVVQCSNNNNTAVALTAHVRYAVLLGTLHVGSGGLLQIRYIGPVTLAPSTPSPSAVPTTLQPTNVAVPEDNNFNSNDSGLIIGLCATIGAATGLFASVLLYQQRQKQNNEVMIMMHPAVLNVKNPGFSNTENVIASPPPPPPSESYEDYAEKQMPQPPPSSPPPPPKSKFFLRAPRGFHSHASKEDE